MLIIAGLAGGYVYYRVFDRLIKRTTVSLDAPGGGALNFLIVGSDSREGLDTPEDVTMFGEVGGRRADTVILAQVVPSQQRGVLVHLPRDLWVTVHAGERQFQSKINAAYQFGPQSVVDTVRSLTRVPINRYMEIDIRGFRSIVDAIGGIDVCQDAALYDSKLNYRLPAGESHLDGNLALSYVRARHATPDGDFGRIKRQQQFIRAVLSKVGKPSVLGNPVRVNELARAFAGNVTVDQEFHLDDLIRLAIGVRQVGPDDLETYSVPANAGRAGGQSVVLMDTPKAEVLFSALRDVADPKSVVPAEQAAPSFRPLSGLSPDGLSAQGAPCPPKPAPAA